MEEHNHNPVLQLLVGVGGMIASFFIKHEAVIHSFIAAVSFFGSFVLVVGGLINMFTGWTFAGWLKKKRKR